jgi:hypothetical protein
MSSQPSPPLAPNPAREDDGLGFGFYAKLAALCVVGGIVGAVVMWVFFRAVYAWGLFGGFIAFALLLLAAGWILDRRQANRDPLT